MSLEPSSHGERTSPQSEPRSPEVQPFISSQRKGSSSDLSAPHSSTDFQKNENALKEKQSELALTFHRLQLGADALVKMTPTELRSVIGECQQQLRKGMHNWASVDAGLRGLPSGPAQGESWFSGPYAVARQLRILDESLYRIATMRPDQSGLEALRLKPKIGRSGQVSVDVLPHGLHDQVLFTGYRGEVRFIEGTTAEELHYSTAEQYVHPHRFDPGITAVITPSNNSAIAPTDLIEEIFVERNSACVKIHPDHSALIPVYKDIFSPLIELGVLAFEEGDALVGEAIYKNSLTSRVKFTGSARVGEMIEAELRELGRDIPIVREQGSITPLFVLPGAYRRTGSLKSLASKVVDTIVHNGGYNCISTRMVCLPDQELWPEREQFEKHLVHELRRRPNRDGFVPGAEAALERARALSEGNLTEYHLGNGGSSLPWIVMDDLDAREKEHPLFKEECFAPAMNIVNIPGKHINLFTQNALQFANETLWGSLGASVFHGSKLNGFGKQERNALHTLVDKLEYGTVAAGTFIGHSWATGVTPFGAHPASRDSGNGFGHNALLLPSTEVEKSVLWYTGAPFKDVWRASHSTAHQVGPVATEIESRPIATLKIATNLLPKATALSLIGTTPDIERDSSLHAVAIRHDLPKRSAITHKREQKQKESALSDQHQWLRKEVKQIERLIHVHGQNPEDLTVLNIAGAGVLGSSMGRLFGAMGCRVITADIRLDQAEAISDEINQLGGTGIPFQLDVTSAADWKLMEECVSDNFHGTLDTLINGAGISQHGETSLVPDDVIEQQLLVNLGSVMTGTRRLLPLLKQKKNRTIDGFLLNVGSIGGRARLPNMAYYAATKAGVNAFTEAIVAEVINEPIFVSCLEPSWIRNSKLIERGHLINSEEAKRQQRHLSYSSLTAPTVAKLGIFGNFAGKPKIQPGWEAKAIGFFSNNFPSDRKFNFKQLNRAERLIHLRAQLGWQPDWDEAISNTIFESITAPFATRKLEKMLSNYRG